MRIATKGVKFARYLLYAFALLLVCATVFAVVTIRLSDNEDLWVYKAYAVLSDSMKDTFAAGDVVIIKRTDVETLSEGDIIAFYSFDPATEGEVFTHKIRDIILYNGELAFTTYGTSTGDNDAYPALASRVIGELAFVVPNVGIFSQFAKTTQGLVLVVIIPILLCLFFEVKNLIKLLQGEAHKMPDDSLEIVVEPIAEDMPEITLEAAPDVSPAVATEPTADIAPVVATATEPAADIAPAAATATEPAADAAPAAATATEPAADAVPAVAPVPVPAPSPEPIVLPAPVAAPVRIVSVSVATVEQLLAAIVAGKRAVLAANITLAYAPASAAAGFGKCVAAHGANIDLNNFTLTYEIDFNAWNSLDVGAHKTLRITGGSLYLPFVNCGGYEPNAKSAIYMHANASLVLDGVGYSTNGAGVSVWGGAQVTINRSSVTAPTYCVTTNIGDEAYYGNKLHYTDSVFTTTAGASVPVMTNVPTELIVSGCTIYSHSVGVLVRGGTARIERTAIYCDMTREYYMAEDGGLLGPITDYFLDREWDYGTAVPSAGVVLGNRGNSGYAYSTSCSLQDVSVTLTGKPMDCAVCAWGQGDEGVTLTLDYADCNFGGNLYAGGERVTINGQVVS